MNLSEAMLLFGSGYISVFLLAFQSRNAVAGRYVTCFFTSFLIGLSQLQAFRGAITSSSPWLAAVILGAAGGCGVCSAMWVNLNLLKHRKV